MDESTESYILLLLADGNLPTGSFVASSGLESYVKHGFFSSNPSPHPTSSSSHSNQAVIDFIQDNLGTYARSALPFVSDAHIAVSSYRAELEASGIGPGDESGSFALQRIIELDALYESMTLNTVARRASKAQGVALLTLLSKGFSFPLLHYSTTRTSDSDNENVVTRRTAVQVAEHRMAGFNDNFKLLVRRDEAHGHLPVCWGILTAALGLSLERSQHLHLFLQARSLLSASIRLNILGPYASQQILLHVVRHVVDVQLGICKDLRTGLQPRAADSDGEVAECAEGPAVTWPLGELLAARHDLQHSRIFNS